MKFSSALFFMRREDYTPPQTPPDSLFRKFNVSCLKCNTFKLRLHSFFDEEAGEAALVLVCTECGQRERLPFN